VAKAVVEDGHHSHFSAMSGDFPKVQGGGSLILAWQIRGKNVLMVGGGEVRVVAQTVNHPANNLLSDLPS
jgi:hypothetical protein